MLNEISEWADGDGEYCIFWLNGMAGTGKSTIARTVADMFYAQKRLAASFFFSRGGGDVGSAGKFFATVARQLGDISPVLRRHICVAITEQKEIVSQTLRDQWNQLILQPLSKLDPTSLQSPLIIVIDALDECEGDNDIRLLLQLLAESKSLKSVQLRIFLTSRPEIPVRLGFRPMPAILHHDLVLHDVPRLIVDRDISLFLRVQFREISSNSEYLPADWPGDKAIDRLVQKADGLFIYAATVCRFIKTNDQWLPRDLLDVFLLPSEASNHSENLLRRIPSTSPTAELDAIYTQILQHSIKGVRADEDKEQLSKDFKQVIGSIVVLFGPLSPAALGKLLECDQEAIYLRLRHLRSVLNVPDDQNAPIRLLHPSFRDFLLDKQRRHDPHFWVDEKKAHAALANCCIRLMSSSQDGLRKDICGLRAPGTLVSEVKEDQIDQYLPAELQYACRYWVWHLQKSNTPLHNDEQVHVFLQEHLLHWLEALGLMKKTSEGVLAITSLESMVTVGNSLSVLEEFPTNIMIKADKNPHLHAFIHDAKRFALYNRSIMEEAPLQIYCSALVFAPEMSIVREYFKKQIPHWIGGLPKVQRDWSSLEQTLEGHSGSVRA